MSEFIKIQDLNKKYGKKQVLKDENMMEMFKLISKL